MSRSVLMRYYPAALELFSGLLVSTTLAFIHAYNTPQALAGTCPVTDASGKSKRFVFRRACDREFRQIAQQWARCSLRNSLFAVAFWQQVRPRCRSEHDAYRRLANRWLAVLWKFWRNREPYDEAYHLQQCRLRSQPRAWRWPCP